VPQRKITLTHEQDEFVERIVRAGEYQDANEAIRDALRALQQRRQEDALKLERLRLQIRAGIDDLEDGDFAEIDDADLDAYIEGLGGGARSRSR
jgi:antitoxin ParD1/3/4